MLYCVDHLVTSQTNNVHEVISVGNEENEKNKNTIKKIILTKKNINFIKIKIITTKNNITQI